MTLYVVRHAKAGSRSAWPASDDLRPLTKPGRRQAEGVADALAGVGITRILSSPYVRCRQTVEPLGERTRLPVDLSDALSEGAAGVDTLALLDKLGDESAALCTHGDVIGELLRYCHHHGVATGDRAHGEGIHLDLRDGVRGHRQRPLRRAPGVSGIADVDGLIDTLSRGRSLDDGEGVDLLAHSLQCAANLAAAAPDDAELQVAGLVHDLGTILEPGRPATHARTGGDAVRDLLGARVADLVACHDVAKRYLVTTDPDYRSELSDQSVVTLAIQGGDLDDDERVAFEAAPDFEACLTLRRADDAAKVPGRVVRDLGQWRPLLDQLSRPVNA